MGQTKVGVIIPTRGKERARFVDNCLRQMETQTLKPHEIALVDYEPETIYKDITQRYRKGYDALRNMGLDVIALIEDDEFYSPEYLEYMTAKWVEYGKPQLFGASFNWYYNLRMKAYHKMEHHTQSHAMSTLIKPDLNFPWCHDNEAFTDVYLWNLRKYLTGVIFTPEKNIAICMKHGVGLTGGNSHRDNDSRYKNKDADMAWLRSQLTPESFEFFATYFD
jgi:hypothetical protein